MPLCSSCSSALRGDERTCPRCGSPLDVSATPTGTAPRGATPPHSPAPGPGLRRERSPSARSGVSGPAGASGESRFVPGTVLADRYRIVQILGRGGMGEVYRADDLKLGLTVALKFLPEGLEHDPQRLERLFNEVRVARRISHSAVCRVHDVGEVDGRHFISMEFVDGEDLASLLRRIGRLSADKALDIARQLCVGVAAAHARGVLHRDLKPQNVMLDGRGQVCITDFGLAGLAQAIGGEDVRSGTPAFMSPEQLDGREVTARSDVYALGLVLYELFTGRRPFEGRTLDEVRRGRERPPRDPAELVPDLDPTVGRAILRCLEADPAARPPSALGMAALLPGGDLLAAAQAAGATPSPEMVAAAGASQRTLSPAVAAALLAITLTSLAVAPVVARSRSLFRLVPFEKTPAVLEDRARDLLRRAGHGEAALDSARGFSVDEDLLNHVSRDDPSPGRWDALASGQPPAVHFWYRDSPRSLASRETLGRVFFLNPPPTLSGMRGVRYDMRGRLLYFYAVPPQREEAPGPSLLHADWSMLLTEAGLDASRLEKVDPSWTPPHYADERVAWEGVWPDRPEVPLRVEGASYRGRPAYFQLLAPWTHPDRVVPLAITPAQRAGAVMGVALVLAVAAVALLLARRNLALGRGDRKGARRLAVAAFMAMTVSWALIADHVFDLFEELALVARGLGFSLLLSTFLWICYVAAEPYVRRRWPHTLISWTRLVGGGWRDPLVGRDLLVGLAAGGLAAVLVSLAQSLPRALGYPDVVPRAFGLDLLLGPRRVAADLGFALVSAVTLALFVLFLILVFRLLLRRAFPAILLALAVVCLPESVALGLPLWLALPLDMLLVGLPVFVLVRFGLLGALVAFYTMNRLVVFPLTDDLADWTAGPTLVLLVVLALLALHGLRTALGGWSPFARLTAPE